MYSRSFLRFLEHCMVITPISTVEIYLKLSCQVASKLGEPNDGVNEG
jgi:hypothetical protein